MKATDQALFANLQPRRIRQTDGAAPYPMSPLALSSTARKAKSLSRWVSAQIGESHQVEITHKLDFLTPTKRGSKR